MNRFFPRWAAGAIAVAAAFVAGVYSASGGGTLAAATPTAELPALPAAASPQGRGSGPPITPKAPPPRLASPPASQPLPTDSAEPPLLWGGDSGQAASADGMIAVTGSYGVGTSVLYVLDTRNKQLAVYEARGGSPAGRRLVLVGARRIDLDLQLEGYRDESEYSYRELQQMFDRRGAAPATGASGVAVPSSTAVEKSSTRDGGR